MTRLEALKLARKHEGIQVWAYGSYKNNESTRFWGNPEYHFEFLNGKLISEYQDKATFNRDELRSYNNDSWTIKDVKKVANTKIARKVYGKNIIVETETYLLIKDEK